MKKPVVCAYYFPNWHSDPRNDQWHGIGWTEWEVVKCARPRFDGHQQPKVPVWGYEDESLPEVMAKKIAVAASHGIDSFIFDWYWFADGSFRAKCLDGGFLGAPNSSDMKFAVMWANHDPIYAHPGSRLYPAPALLDGAASPLVFRAATEYCIKNYFPRPNYLRQNGGLYFSVFLMSRMIKDLGGVEEAKAIFKDFRDRVRDAGLGELHLNVIINSGCTPEAFAAFESIGIDSYGSYNWEHMQDQFPVNDYSHVEKLNNAAYETITGFCGEKPYNPNITMGWDVSPRTVQSEVYENLGYPFCGVCYGTPGQFEHALKSVKTFFESKKCRGELITLNAWNEWTEGSYLEPDEIHQMGYLEAVRNVFVDGK